MAVEAGMKERVRRMLLDSTGEVRDFLRPEGAGAELRFYLDEILLIGRR
jgi:hypothetical protein